jgi:arabinoxylan arabinofuranohydrolase
MTNLVQRKFVIAAPLFCIVASYSAASLADNPIVQTNYTSDPAPMVDGETMYLVTTHDENVAGQPCSEVAGYTLCQWYTFSSKDMVNWTDHGVVAKWSTFTWASTAAWAPQAIPRNGKFYIYVPLTAKSGGTQIGVGVATSPTGPYQDAIGKSLVTAGCSGGTGDIDPTVFIDDDGQAYLYFGRSVPGYVKLNSDMTSYTGSVQCPTVNSQSFGPAVSDFPSQYEEGPWITKHGTTYFLAYAANGIPEDIAYSKATTPGGPFTYVGTIMKANGASFTNHTGIIDFAGHSYFFYHNGALKSGGSVPKNGDGYHRSVCLEEFTYNADGSIPTIPPTTGGPKAIATLNPYLKNEAETIAWESGVTTEVCGEGGMDVTSIGSGDYIKVKNVDFGAGATSFTARVAATAAGGTIQIRLASQTGTLVGTCNVSATGGTQTWADTTCTISGASGVNDLFFVFGGSTFNFNNWQFTGSGGGSTGTGGTSSMAGGPSTGGGPPAGGMAGAGGTRTTGGSSSAAGSKATGGSVSAGGSLALGGATSTGGSRTAGGTSSISNTGGGTTLTPTGGRLSTGGNSNQTGGTVSSTGGSAANVGGNATGGLVGAGGTPAIGGASALGGLGGTVGAATSQTLTSATNNADPSNSGGCGCRVAKERSNSKLLAMLGVTALLLMRTRRRALRAGGRSLATPCAEPRQD